ncbi:MAG: TonB-dependent receptor, partial [Parabacteroides sp.]|nr:TonB-dependent receptor [Parabacteroides sp.]
INLKGVVVSATKIEVNKNSVPMSVSVIDRNEIEASSESALLPVLSQRVPGLFVTQKGITGFGVSEGAAGTVNIRGVGQSNKVLVLFDGQPQWAGVFGHALPDTYVASDVERVEVIRGPGSLLYGSNAMGGVINIITRHQKEEGRTTQARVMYGSYNTQKYMINTGYNAGKFSSFISINHDRTDGHRMDSEFRMTNGFAKLGYTLTDHYKVTGDLSLAKSKYQNPGKITAPIRDNIMDILRGTTSFAVENKYEKSSGAVRAFYNWGNHEINDGLPVFSSVANNGYLFRSDDHNYGVLLYQSFRLLKDNLFTVGVDYKNWGGHAWNDSIIGPDKDLVDKSVSETAGYIIMQQDLFEKVSLNAGVRYEHNSIFGGEWVPQAGITYRPVPGNTLKASLSKGFRSPNLREMYMFLPQNPDLKPERMMNYEMSVGQSLLEGKLFAELTAFYIDGSNMIEETRIDGRPKNVNTGSFTNKGFEFEAAFTASNKLMFDMNYSYLHTSKALLAAPAHKFFVNATYTPGRFTFNVNVQSIFDLYVNTVTPVKEDYTLLNAKAAYRFGSMRKGLNLFVKGENLTATRYTINEGFPMPKAIVMGGFDITF